MSVETFVLGGGPANAAGLEAEIGTRTYPLVLFTEYPDIRRVVPPNCDELPRCVMFRDVYSPLVTYNAELVDQMRVEPPPQPTWDG